MSEYKDDALEAFYLIRDELTPIKTAIESFATGQGLVGNAALHQKFSYLAERLEKLQSLCDASAGQYVGNLVAGSHQATSNMMLAALNALEAAGPSRNESCPT